MPALMEQEQPQTFAEWFKKNEEHLRNYAPDEIARVALVCGFVMPEIAPKVADWIAVSKRKLALWESPFHEKWMRAHLAQMGKDFDD